MATREEIYAAIRNADASGDSAAVRKLGEYLKTLPADDAVAAPAADMTEHRARLAQAQTDLADAQDRGTAVGRGLNALGEIGTELVKGAGDTALTLGANAVMTPLAGLAGAVASPFVGADRAAGIVNTIQGAAYQPKSDVGQEAMGNISKPFTWIAGKADQAGQVAADVTGSPLIGAGVNAALQGAPAFLSRGTRGSFASAGRGVMNAAKGVAGVGESAESTAATAAAQAQSTAAAATAAENYARSVGLDWNALADGVRDRLTQIARTSGQLEQLDPAALKRFATLQGLKVPVLATRGAITRDPVLLRNEGNAAATTEGASIRDTHLAGDNALQANLDILKGRVAGTGKSAATATTSEQAGRVVQGAARGKEAVSKANYDRLYKVARETEPDARAPIAPVTDLLTGNPEIQHLGWVQSWLNKAAKLAGGKEGEPVQLTEATLAELNDLRSQASAIARTGGKEGYYAGQVSAAINKAMEAVPAGAKAWRAANNAFKAHKGEFADQAAVADLVDDASRTDRATALERTVDTITKGSLEDLRKVKRSLLTGGDEATRTAGKQAMREIRAQVIERIKREATKSATEKADGTPNLSVAKLKQVIDSYGPEKLDEIFGPGNAREIARILDAAKIVKTLPPGAPIGSSTLQNVLAFLGKGIEKVPLVGGPAVDVARGIASVKKLGANARAAAQANKLPLNEALDMAKAKAASSANRKKLGGLKTAPLSSLSAGANKQ